MSKVLLISGSPNQHGCTDTALQEVSMSLNKNGVESEIYWIGKKPISGCIACAKCFETGHCVFTNDGLNDILARLPEFDGIIVGSPVYYSGPAGNLCSFLDRLFFAGMAQNLMHGKLAASVVYCRRGGASATFERLNQYFLMSNMIVIGAQYWNQVHGFTPDDVRKDKEGLQTMRTLGQNMAWILQSIEAGKKAGIHKPVYEEPEMTNFID